MKFKLEIKMGNEAMQTPDDVAAVLRKMCARLEDQSDFHTLEIRDIMGNIVGVAEIQED